MNTLLFLGNCVFSISQEDGKSKMAMGIYFDLWQSFHTLIFFAVNTPIAAPNVLNRTSLTSAHPLLVANCITLARVMCYKAPGRSFPDHIRCIRPAVPEGKAYPGAELILTPPATLEPVLIDENMVSNMLSEYKSHFPKVISKKEAAQ